MYKELIDESEAQKKITENLEATQRGIKKMKHTLKSKREILFQSKERIVAL